MKKYTVIDLFAGAGGLSYGFLQTGLDHGCEQHGRSTTKTKIKV